MAWFGGSDNTGNWAAAMKEVAAIEQRFGAASADFTAKAAKFGIEDSLQVFVRLMKNVDTYIVELANRLGHPSKSLLGRPAEDKALTRKCMTALTSLHSVIHYRIALAEDKPNDIELPDPVKGAIGILLGLGVSDTTGYTINHRGYGIAPTPDASINLLISMADLLEQLKTCSGKRLENLAVNTASVPGAGKLGTKSFKGDVINLLEITTAERDLLERATRFARLETRDKIFDVKKQIKLANRLRSLRDLPPLNPDADPRLRGLLAQEASLTERIEGSAAGGGGGAAAGGGGAGGGSYRMGGGARKTRKTRRNRKARKARKTRRHQ